MSSTTAQHARDPQFCWPTSHVGALHPFSPIDSARDRTLDFVKFARASLDGTSYSAAKSLLRISTNQAETRKSLLEEFGLLYVVANSDRITVTPLGRQLLEAIGDGRPLLTVDAKRRVDALLAWALSNCQINRPQSRGAPRPDDSAWQTCEIRPYAACWQAMLDLGGHITVDEFFGVLWHIHSVDHYRPAIERILDGRTTGRSYLAPSAFSNGGPLFNPRIYWLSHLSCGEGLLVVDRDSGALRFRDDTRQIIEAVLNLSRGCVGDPSAVSFRSRNYSSTDEYFMDVAGRTCPPFLSNGTVRVVSFENQQVAVLQNYALQAAGSAFVVDGGPELCSLPLLAVSYHPDNPNRLLRLDQKSQVGATGVRLRFGLGRPVNSPAALMDLLVGGGGQ